MTVSELIERLKSAPPDVEVFLRCVVPDFTRDIVEAHYAAVSYYSFFGKRIPCVILEPEG